MSEPFRSLAGRPVGKCAGCSKKVVKGHWFVWYPDEMRMVHDGCEMPAEQEVLPL